MILSNKNRIFIFAVLNIFLSLSIANSVCLNSPTQIKVSSGSSDIGNFSLSYLTSGNAIYIKDNLKNYPLKIKFLFKNIDDDCFTSGNDLNMKLAQNGMTFSADSFSEEGDYTVAEFNFDLDFTMSDSLTSTYTVKHKDNSEGTSGNIHFTTDTEVPLITIQSKTPTASVIQTGTEVSINYYVADDKSGLDTLTISGGISEIINFQDNNKTFSGSINGTLTSSQTYTFTVKDKLGNEATENVEFMVDGKAPIISNFDVKGYSYESSGTRTVSFSVDVEDESFEIIDSTPEVYGNFSLINSQKTNEKATCTKDLTAENKYTCSWNRIVITELDATTNVAIKIKATDSVGNPTENSFSHEIFYDTEGPQITEFYLENSMGVTNIFNALDKSAKVYLKFTDESADDNTDINIIPDFNGIDFFIVPEINITDGVGTVIWNLSDTLQKYSGLETGEVTFSILLKDKYSNPSSQSINITYNNNKPQITKIELVETNDLKDGIVKSGEKINFEVFVEDDNFEQRDGFIYANFSAIDFRDGMEKKQGSCGAYNETTFLCNFNDIVVDNGHMRRNVTFYAIDLAANVKIKQQEVEVFAIGNESPTSFKIEDISITNILNRHVISTSGSNAWFEGKIENIGNSENDNMKIVNYQLKSCNDSEMMPILLGDRVLYPDEIMQGNSTDEPSRDFILKTEVKSHPNFADLNTKSMRCTISILKRDDETVYSPELVDFNINYDFYDLPYDNLLKAEAQSILGKIDDAESLGSWFDSTYKIYSIMDTICTTLNTVKSLLGTASSVVYGIQWIMIELQWFPPAKTASEALGQMSHRPNNMLGTITDNGIVKKMCAFVTCENGGLLGDFWAGTKAMEFYNDVNSLWGMADSTGELICTGSSSDEGGSDNEN